MPRKPIVNIMFIVIVFALLLGADHLLAADPPTIKVGILKPLTGPAATIGRKFADAHLFAIEEINKNGGIKSLNGAKLEAVVADTQSMPETGITECEKLITVNKVVAILGAFQSSVTYPTTQVAERHGVPYIVPNSTADAITERGFKYTFGVRQKASWYPLSQFGFIRDIGETTGVKAKTFAFLHEDTEWGMSTSEGWKKWLDKNGNKNGFKLSLDLPYPHSAPDLSSEITRLKASAPDVLIAASYTPDAILLGRSMDELDFRPRLGFIGSAAGHSDTTYLKALGPLAEGDFSFAGWSKDLKMPVVKEFSEKMDAKFGKGKWVWMQAYCYASMYVLKDALERAASIDREAIRDALAKTRICEGPATILPLKSDCLVFDEQQQLHTYAVVTQVQNGRFVSVWPFGMAGKQAVWPVK